MSNTNTTIPVFPLRTVIFPGHSLPLKVFEARYLKLLQDCSESGQKKFAIALISTGEEVGEAATPFRVGSLVHYDGVMEANGVSFITPVAQKRVYFQKFIRGRKPYLEAEYIDYHDEETSPVPEEQLEKVEKRLSNLWISGSSAQSKETFSKMLLKKHKLSGENYSLFLCGCLKIPLINLQHLLESKSPQHRIDNLAHLLSLEKHGLD